MATFNVPMLGTEIKPVPQTSLGDMLNIARGAQQYQQAQQINPLELQAKQQATRTGEIQLGVAEQADKERRNMQTFFADPNNFQTNGRIDIDKINKVVPTIAPLTGSEYINKYTTLGNAQTEAIKAKQGLTQEQRSMVAQRFSILGRLGVKDKNAYIAEMDLLKKENPDNPDLSRLIDSYKTIWEGTMQSGDDLPAKAIAGAQTLLTPAQQQTQFAPTVTTTAEGKTITNKPSVAGEMPTSTMGTAGGLQANVPSTGGPSAVGAGAEVAPGMRVPYPVRRADQPYMAEPTEQKDQAAGAEYRNNLVNGQMGLAQGRRNVEEVMEQANKINQSLIVPNFLAKFGFEKGGAPEAAERAVRQFFGSEQYDMLAKDLANMAITNSKAMGSVGGTVAGLDMASVANGTIKVTPDVLIKIARRVQADQTNLDMQADGAQKFAEKFGDNNMKAYQQVWNKNADSKIFEAMNIVKDVTDPNVLDKELNRLFPKPAEREQFLKKYRNLKQLSETGVVRDK
jgi:hypothetical protein